MSEDPALKKIKLDWLREVGTRWRAATWPRRSQH
jgi:hypothetical protein